VSDWVATVDLSNPSVPLHIGRSDDLGGTPLRIAAGRGFAYVATGAGGLKVVDATNPLLPVVVGTFDTQADLMNVVLSPDQRHVAGLESLGGAGSTQLVVYDVTDPSRPSETGRLALTEGAAAVSLAWPAGYSRVVVTAPSEGVMLVELADVARPRLIARRPLQGAGEAVVRRGDVVPVPSLVGVVNRGSELVPGGLWMLSLSASDDDLLEAGTLVSIDWPDVQGARQASWWDRLLIAASEDDLALYDTRDPSRPRLTFELVDEFQDIHEVQLDGRFAYVSDPIDGFVLLDVIPDR
jgi:hypothetical protein